MLFTPTAIPAARIFTVVLVFFLAGILFLKADHEDLDPSSFFPDRYATLSGIYNANAKGAGVLKPSTTSQASAAAATATVEKQKVIDFGAPTPVATVRQKPSTVMINFWEYWGVVFDSAKPAIRPVELLNKAKSIRPSDEQKKKGYREPYTPHCNLTDEDVGKMKESHSVVVAHIKKRKYKSEDLFSGKGVVIVAGGQFFGPAIVSIRMLRKTGSKLPVEVFLANDEEYEEEICGRALPKLNARCRVLTDYLNTTSSATSRQKDFGEPKQDSGNFQIAKYQLKVMALLLSSFEDVLFLDSDSFPVINPEKELFETKVFQENGMIVYPDFWYSTEDPAFYRIADVPNGYPHKKLPPTSTESGQFVFSKKMHLDSLLLAAYYNIYGPDWYYPLLSQGAAGQGDKETFMAAAAVLDKPFYRVKQPVSVIGYSDKGNYKGTGMVQYAPLDEFEGREVVRPAFVHENLPKLNAAEILDGTHLVDGKGKPHRMWGNKDAMVRKFGRDLEKDVWEEIVGSGCELEGKVKDWEKRKGDVCKRLKAHWKAVFGEEYDKRRWGRWTS